MYFSSVAAVAALAASSSAYTIPRSTDPRISMIAEARMAEEHKRASSSLRPYATTLKPIHPDVFESEMGFEKRDADHHISPATKAHMVYGAPGLEGQIHLANMTVHAPSNLPIVMMERFQGLTKSVDCNGHDGSMSLQFNSKAAFNKAIEKWSYINEDYHRQFVMIANDKSCGKDEQRQAYKINAVDNDETDFSVTLDATPVAWKEVAGTFDLDFGKAAMSEEALNGLVSGINKRHDWSKSIDISFEHGTPNHEYMVFEDFMHNPPWLNLSCTNCFTKGTFQTTGHIRTEDLDPKEVSLEVLPQDIEAELELKAVMSRATGDTDWNSFTKTIFEAPIPGAGIDIPEIFSLGCKFQFNIEGRMMLIGTTTIYMGGKTTIDNGARLNVDLVNMNKTVATNFNANFEPEFRLSNIQLTANAAAGPKPKLVFGIEILDNELEAGLAFGTPTFNMNATAGFNDAGWCNETDPVTSGFKVASAANFDMSLSVTSKVEGDDTTLYTRRLVNIPWLTFLNECWDVPGLTPSNNATSDAKLMTVPRNTPPNVAVPFGRMF